MNLVPATGTARLAQVLRGHESEAMRHQRPELEWGRMVDLGDGTLGLMPDSWTAAAFLPGEYAVLEPFARGLVRTEPATVASHAGGGHGGHTGGGGDHGHDHAEHRHDLEYPILPLAAGDRVLVAWVSSAPVIVGRLSP